MQTTHHTSKAEENVNGTSGCCSGKSTIDIFGVSDIDGLDYDLGGWEVVV